jgi:protocatechuate 3,4-dioxygenase beta subunit
MRRGSTDDLVFTIPYLVHCCSTFTKLAAGRAVEAETGGVGLLRNTVVQSNQEHREAGMQDLTETGITAAVLQQMADTPDPRLREIMAAAVKHLHAFAREVSLTPEEWLYGIKFMTEVGQACTPFRQEFILLSDTLGLSRMVNILHDGRAETVGTETSLLGPFYRNDSPRLRLGDSIAKEPGAASGGREIGLFGTVRDEAGVPVADATVEVWQTDPDGAYDLQAADPTAMDWRAQFRTDEAGRYWFRATLPLGYTIPLDGPVGRMIGAQRRHGCRPAHTHFLIGAPGYRELVTAIYYGQDPYIDSDTVFGVSQSLIVEPQPDVPGSPFPALHSVRFDFTLARAAKGDETSRVGADPSTLAGSGQPAGVGAREAARGA